VEAVAAAPPKSEPVSLTSATFASASQGIFTREVRVCSLVTREAIKDGADAVIAVGGDGAYGFFWKGTLFLLYTGVCLVVKYLVL